MTFVVDHGPEATHYLPNSGEFIVQAEFEQRARAVIPMLTTVASEARIAMLAFSSPVEWMGQISAVTAPIILSRIEDAQEGEVINPISSDDIREAMQQSFMPAGVMHGQLFNGTPHYSPNYDGSYQLALAAGGHLLQVAQETSISITETMGINPRLDTRPFAPSIAINRIAILALVHQARKEGRSIQPREVKRRFHEDFRSSAIDKQIEALIEMGFIVPRNGHDAPYKAHPEFGLARKLSKIEAEDALDERIIDAVTKIHEVEDSPTLNPKRIAGLIYPGEDSKAISRAASRVRARLEEWVARKHVKQTTFPDRVLHSVGIPAAHDRAPDGDKEAIILSLLEVVDGLADPTEEFVATGTEKLQAILAQPDELRYLLQRTRAANAQSGREDWETLNIMLTALMRDGPQTTAMLAKSANITPGYAGKLLRDVEGRRVLGRMEQRNKIWERS